MQLNEPGITNVYLFVRCIDMPAVTTNNHRVVQRCTLPASQGSCSGRCSTAVVVSKGPWSGATLCLRHPPVNWGTIDLGRHANLVQFVSYNKSRPGNSSPLIKLFTYQDMPARSTFQLRSIAQINIISKTL